MENRSPGQQQLASPRHRLERPPRLADMTQFSPPRATPNPPHHLHDGLPSWTAPPRYRDQPHESSSKRIGHERRPGPSRQVHGLQPLNLKNVQRPVVAIKPPKPASAPRRPIEAVYANEPLPVSNGKRRQVNGATGSRPSAVCAYCIVFLHTHDVVQPGPQSQSRRR